MKHLAEFPLCNGLRFLPVESSRNPLYNRVPLDDGLSNELYQDSETPACYTQKWQLQDGIAFQVSTNGAPGFVRIYNSLGVQIGSFYWQSNLSVPGNWLYGQKLLTYLYVFSPGQFPRMLAGEQFYVTLSIGWSDSHQQLFVSEWMSIEKEHSNTVLIQYRNGKNKGDFIWEQFPVRPSFRVEGGIGDLKFGGKHVVSDNVDFSPVLLSSNRWRSFELRLGNGSGVPDWVADKVDAIFGCDDVQIDGKGYQRDGSAMVEIKAFERTPQRDATLKIREALNGAGTRYNSQRILLGTIPRYNFGGYFFKILSLKGTVVDFSGNVFTASVANVIVAYEEHMTAVLASLNGLQPTVKGNGGYFVIEEGKLYFQADDFLEIDTANCEFTYDPDPPPIQLPPPQSTM